MPSLRSAAAFAPALLACFAHFSTLSPMIAEEAGHTRLPPPPPEVIAGLPPDGGEEFNRLVFEKSPYLLQHARNPVDWWPWSEEAFEKARREGKPVFLSIGYTTCHWCHVMEHESFEDEEVAALVNEHYVAVKVDREERPDIDEVYMKVTQAMTGQGGWPMTVVMTPDQHAFFAGTYFPKESSAGRPGIKHVLTELHRAWTEKRDEVVGTAEQISEQLAGIMTGVPGGELEAVVFDQAYAELAKRYDEAHGGFAIRPKFPVPQNLLFLLRQHRRSGDEKALEMVERTLTEIRLGGVYDQVGFGIHRYATDREWLVPHFEKMLYDQALLAMACIETAQVTGKEFYETVAHEIFDYVRRELTEERGGFFSAEDADSEGEEGKFYVWSTGEIRELFGEEDAAFLIALWDFEDEGNYLDEATRVKTGTNIPHLKSILSGDESERLETLRERLFEARTQRVHPQKDDKVLTDWNGLMIAAFARAAKAFDRPDYAEAASRAADFVLKTLRDDDGRLLKRYRDGEAGLTAHLEDYAFLIWGLLDLYEAGFELRYLEEAIALQRIVDVQFWDAEDGGYFTVAEDAEPLIVRSKKLYGGALPSGNAVGLLNLVRLYRITAEDAHRERSEALIRAFSGEVAETPSSYPFFLSALDFHLGPSYEIVVSGEDADEMLGALRRPFLPNKVVLHRTEANAEALARLAPYTEAQAPVRGAATATATATAYVCLDFACRLPTNEVAEMLESLGVGATERE